MLFFNLHHIALRYFQRYVGSHLYSKYCLLDENIINEIPFRKCALCGVLSKSFTTLQNYNSLFASFIIDFSPEF